MNTNSVKSLEGTNFSHLTIAKRTKISNLGCATLGLVISQLSSCRIRIYVIDLTSGSGFAVNCKPVFVLRNRACWVVSPGGWEIPSQRFEGTYRFRFQGYGSVELTHSPENEGAAFIRPQHHILEHFHPLMWQTKLHTYVKHARYEHMQHVGVGACAVKIARVWQRAMDLSIFIAVCKRVNEHHSYH
jgi:hypothetical protein